MASSNFVRTVNTGSLQPRTYVCCGKNMLVGIPINPVFRSTVLMGHGYYKDMVLFD
jgi:hypothetical protein